MYLNRILLNKNLIILIIYFLLKCYTAIEIFKVKNENVLKLSRYTGFASFKHFKPFLKMLMLDLTFIIINVEINFGIFPRDFYAFDFDFAEIFPR